MAPKWLPGGPPEPRPAFEAFLVRSGAARGGSWGLLGSLLAPLGIVLGLPRCPRRLPEGPREGPGEPPGRHFGSILAAGPCATKKVRKNNVFCIFVDVVFIRFLNLFFAFPAAAAQARTLKIMKICFYSVSGVSAVFARNEKNNNIHEKALKKTP